MKAESQSTYEGNAARLRADARRIIEAGLSAANAKTLTQRALGSFKADGLIRVVAVGKAAFGMARAAETVLEGGIDAGAIVSQRRYALSAEDLKLPGFVFFEADHPIPGSGSIAATTAVMSMLDGLSERDTVLLLLSGGGSAMFEDPLISLDRLQDLTRDLLASGACIQEVNTIRKRFSAVKGGRFAVRCAPAKVVCLALSDVIGNDVASIASGIACPDQTTTEDALSIADRYGLALGDAERGLMAQETPKQLQNAQTTIIGDGRSMVQGAAAQAEAMGYRVSTLPHPLTGQAADEGRRFAARLRSCAKTGRKSAVIGYGETVVRIIGDGCGGRNQEFALAASEEIRDVRGTAVFSIGSDGRDGPTDAAGGYADWTSAKKMNQAGIEIHDALGRNDSNTALASCGGAIATMATGTNVNDLMVGLFNPEKGEEVS